MVNTDSLLKQFKNAGLELKILSKPIGRGRGIEHIFQMDIGRKVNGNRRNEWFEIYPGNLKNTVQVLNIDKKSKQLTLLVKEDAREFMVEERKSSWSKDRRRKQLKDSNARFRETKTHFIIFEKTPAATRHFLLGLDERQLFVAQLTKGATTVDAARKLLGSTVQFHEGKRKMTPNRQGEWFFVKATRLQEQTIEEMINKNQAWIQTKANIGEVHGGRRGGNPHVADEIVVIPAGDARQGATRRDGRLVVGKFPVRERGVFVRGKIRHVDHKTVKYSRWYEVILNNEGATSSGQASGISWID